jgi:hypothetical protein
MYVKFSSFSEISDKGVLVLSIQHAPVTDKTLLNTKPEEAKTKVLCSEKQKLKAMQIS